MNSRPSFHLTSQHFLGKVWQLSKPYWQSEEKWMAWGLLIAIVALNLGMVYMSVILNQWNSDFYNALQELDKTAFTHLLIKFSIIAAIFIVIAVYRIYLNMMLQLRWRRWLTNAYLTHWLNDRSYFQLERGNHQTDNPDQRIAEDIDQFTNDTLSLSLGLLNSVVTLASFITILWGLSGPFSFHLAGHQVTIPGFMVWAALIYATVGSFIMHKIGKPLINLNFIQQKLEANFRYSLVRLRENAEGIALYQGENKEREQLEVKFNQVWKNTWQIMRKQKQIVGFNSGYSQIAIIFPIMIAAPSFFSGAIKLGGLMQINNAFGQVMGAVSWFVDSYASIASWKASVDRLTSYNDDMQATKQQAQHSQLVVTKTQQDQLTIHHCQVKLPNGTILSQLDDIQLQSGQHTLISGQSGIGKSTLLKTISGIWPYSEGHIEISQHSLFLPQKPYLPEGTLREVLCYPQRDTNIQDSEIIERLNLCHLGHFASQLDQHQHWSHTMSAGEQQRVAIVRALILQPQWLFLDEATSSLDEETESDIYQILAKQLPNTTLVSIAHRSKVAHYHQYRLHAERSDEQVNWQFSPMEGHTL
ncbi:ABC transporter ATP-binding protein/permease [Vibrio rumoiensis]|uniref:ABC transporter ATP-binding protein n=1 Tax=Vibrio rumoiensis 1S-45 TaxID=1188252 RepID=A0A1E5E333_9VIBR|nr:ABC transporter ATP-binding protein/permease [Vibrio rumoiensis]OEF26080.1 ABC transporter ATP-binding protein [Vibrio rumoiensis 1S-45]